MLKVLFRVILGLGFLSAGILAILRWRDAFWTLFTASLGLILILIGVLILSVSKD